jgi:hypothetical protein
MSPEKENLVTVGCKITVDEMELLDARAEKAGLSGSEYMRRVIQTAVALRTTIFHPLGVLLQNRLQLHRRWNDTAFILSDAAVLAHDSRRRRSQDN